MHLFSVSGHVVVLLSFHYFVLEKGNVLVKDVNVSVDGHGHQSATIQTRQMLCLVWHHLFLQYSRLRPYLHHVELLITLALVLLFGCDCAPNAKLSTAEGQAKGHLTVGGGA